MSYLVSKFVRRNRVAVAAAVLVLGSLSGGLVSSLRAQRRERARFDQVRSLVTTFLVDFDRDIRQLPGATAARERLVKTGLDTLDGLSRDAGGDPKLTAELAQAYISLGDVVGSPGGSSLGHADRAEVAFRKAFDLARPLVARDAAYRPQAALSCLRMGYLLWRTARSEEGRKWILDGIGYLQPAIDAGTATSRDYRLAANGMAYLSQMERQNRHGKQSAEYSVKSVELMRKYQTGAEDAFRARSDLARALSVAGNASAAAGDIARGAQLQRESLEIRKTNAAERPNDVENLREMGVAYRFLSDVEFAGGAPSLGNEAAANAARGEYYRLFRRLAEADRRNASAQHDYGLCLREMAGSAGDLKEAEAYAREGIRVMEGRPPNSPSYDRHVGLLWAVLGGILKKQGRTAEAQAAMERGVRGYAKENVKDGLARGDFIQLWHIQGNYEKIWDIMSPARAGAAEDIYLAYELADCARRLGKADEAAAIWAPWKGKFPITDRALGL